MRGKTTEEKGTFVEHLGELRRRLIYVLIVFVLTLVIGMVMSTPIITYLKEARPASEIEWNVFSPWDSLRIYMNVSFAVATIITLPFALYQIWAFVKPGLRKEEQTASLLFVPAAFLLALLGMAFGYFIVFPMAFFFLSFLTDTLSLTETYGAAQYLGFMFNILLPLAVFFELPLVIMFLTKLRILKPSVLRKFRRYAYFFLFIISAVITPPDLISAILVSIPMLLLYEFSIVLSRRVYNKQQAADEEFEQTYRSK